MTKLFASMWWCGGIFIEWVGGELSSIFIPISAIPVKIGLNGFVTKKREKMEFRVF